MAEYGREIDFERLPCPIIFSNYEAGSVQEAKLVMYFMELVRRFVWFCDKGRMKNGD